MLSPETEVAPVSTNFGIDSQEPFHEYLWGDHAAVDPRRSETAPGHRADVDLGKPDLGLLLGPHKHAQTHIGALCEEPEAVLVRDLLSLKGLGEREHGEQQATNG